MAKRRPLNKLALLLELNACGDLKFAQLCSPPFFRHQVWQYRTGVHVPGPENIKRLLAGAEKLAVQHPSGPLTAADLLGLPTDHRAPTSPSESEPSRASA